MPSVSRSTNKPYWHHKDSNETRWSKPGIGPGGSNDENAPPADTQSNDSKGLLQSLDEKLQVLSLLALPIPKYKY
jgi:hypothetical protein